MDFNETILKSPLKKFSGITNFQIIGQKDDKNESSNVDKTEDKLEQERQLKMKKQYVVGGIKMQIKDIMNIA